MLVPKARMVEAGAKLSFGLPAPINLPFGRGLGDTCENSPLSSEEKHDRRGTKFPSNTR